MNNTSFTNNTLAPQEEDYSIILYLSVSVGFVGFTSHCLVLSFTYLSEVRKHQVGHIIALISFAEGILCVYFGLWLPLTYVTQQPLGTTSAWFTEVIFCAIASNGDIILAVNRYTATCRPVKYKSVFSERRTKQYILAMLVGAFLVCIPYGVPGCRLSVDYAQFRIGVDDAPCGRMLAIGTMVSGALAFVATILNMVTFRKLKATSKEVARSIADKEAKHRQKSERDFFVQSCVTSTLISVGVLSVYVLPLAVEDNKWAEFYLTSFTSLVLYALDGVAVLLLNGTIRRELIKRIRAAKCAWEKINVHVTGEQVVQLQN